MRFGKQSDMLSGAQDLRVIIQRGYALRGEVLIKQTHLVAARHSSLEENYKTSSNTRLSARFVHRLVLKPIDMRLEEQADMRLRRMILRSGYKVWDLGLSKR
jgi:hypothetical protein